MYLLFLLFFVLSISSRISVDLHCVSICFSLFLLAKAKHLDQRDPGTTIKANVRPKEQFLRQLFRPFMRMVCIHPAHLDLPDLLSTETHRCMHAYAKVSKILEAFHPQRDLESEEHAQPKLELEKISHLLSNLTT